MIRKLVFAVALIVLIALDCLGQNKIIQPWGVTPGEYTKLEEFGNNPASMFFYSDMRMKFARLGEEVNLTLGDIDGTIYLNENFTLGTLYAKGEAFKKLYIRYDAYNDEIELKETLESDVVRSMVKHPVYSCSVNGNEYYYLGYTDEDGNPQKGYLTPLVTGEDYTLFVKHIKVFKEGKPAKTSLDNSFPHRFLDKTEYYVSKTGEAPVFMKTRKSDVLLVFSEGDQKVIKEYMRDKRPNVNDGDDLLNLFTYANTL